MPTELGWRTADQAAGGVEAVNDENPLPVYVVRMPPLDARTIIAPQPFTFPLAGSASMLVKNGQGFLNSVIATNINAGIRYLQIFNQKVAPASGDVPVLVFPIPAGSAIAPGGWTVGAEILGPEGLYLSNGVCIGISTTAATFTAATVTDHIVSGLFT